MSKNPQYVAPTQSLGRYFADLCFAFRLQQEKKAIHLCDEIESIYNNGRALYTTAGKFALNRLIATDTTKADKNLVLEFQSLDAKLSTEMQNLKRKLKKHEAYDTLKLCLTDMKSGIELLARTMLPKLNFTPDQIAEIAKGPVAIAGLAGQLQVPRHP